MRKIIIAIDGVSGSGKSSTSRAVAEELGYLYIDTGAMYRAVTYFFEEKFITLTNAREVQLALDKIDLKFAFNPKTEKNEIFLNGLQVETEIRKMYISQKVSQVSAIPAVRQAMVKTQRKLGKRKGVVMDGRDIGTVVFPEAELKVFMTADVRIRAERRQKELLEAGQMVNFEEIVKNLKNRDEIDANREVSPLRKAEDSVWIDSSQYTLTEQIDLILELATSRMIEGDKIRPSNPVN